MYAYLKGIITEKNPDSSSFVLELSGIGHLIYTNLKFLNDFTVDKEAKVYTSMSVREDSFKLHGFPSRAARDLYEILISVSGIGPKAALNILGTLEIDRLISAVLKENANLIAEAPGVGLKTAKRVILELKSKLNKFSSRTRIGSEDNEHKDFNCAENASLVLANLGFSAAEIDENFAKAKNSAVADDVETLVRFCLKQV